MGIDDFIKDNILDPIEGGINDAVDFISDPIQNIIIDPIEALIKNIIDIPKLPEPEKGVLVNKQSNINKRPVVYGYRRVGGTRIFVGTSGAENEYLHIVLDICEGEVFSLSNVEIDGISEFDSRFNGLKSIRTYTGTATQASDSILQAAFPEWTAAHQLKGVAYIACRFKMTEEGPYRGIPTVTAIVSGKKVFDPRTSTTYSTPNAALCIRDYLTNTIYGKGIPTASIDDSSFIDAANTCELMEQKHTASAVYNGTISSSTTTTITDTGASWSTDEHAGRVIKISSGSFSGWSFVINSNTSNTLTVVPDIFPAGLSGITYGIYERTAYETKYEINGVIDTNQTLLDNLKSMLVSCRGMMPYIDGKYSLLIEDKDSSVYSFNDDNILGEISVSERGKDSRVNRCKVKFVNPAKNWLGDFAVVESSTYLTIDKNVILEKEYTLPHETSYSRALHTSDVLLKSSREGIIVAFTATIDAYKVIPGNIVDLTIPSFGWTNETFRVRSMDLNIGGNIDFVLTEHEPSVYDRNVTPELPPPPNTNLPDPFIVAAPSNFNAVSDDTTISLYSTSSGNKLVYGISLSWTVAPDLFVTRYNIQYKKSTDSVYKDAAPVIGQSSNSSFIDNIEDGVTYDLRIRAENGLGYVSAWVTDSVAVSTASEFIIGGWKVGGGGLSQGTGGSSVGLDTGGTNPAIFAGDATPANAPFRVFNNGSLFATNATISGVITAISGAIGGWIIGTSVLTSGSGSTTVGLDSGGSNPAFYAGSATPGSAPFRVLNTGALTASNATITGNITANTLTANNSGTIGGWTITATELKTGSGGTTRGLSTGTIAIYVGNATPGSAPFRVTDAGALVTTNATVTGDITANTLTANNSGSIAGWTITSSELKAGSGATTRGISSGSIAFYAGSATPASAPFRVDTSGNLVATSATVTGAITATSLNASGSGNLAGFTISATSLTVGSGATTVGIDSGGSNPAIYAGSSTPGSAPFRVTNTGALTASNATITGNITANTLTASTSGTIGGWNISASGIKLGSGATTRGLDTGSIAFYAGDASPTLAPFRVDTSGAVTASNATITGSITASFLQANTSGSIAGWNIDATGLFIGTGATTRGLSTGSIAFYAGNATPASAPFRVGTDGGLTANNANITGNITANTLTASVSGTIAGWNISASGIILGSGSTTRGLSTGSTAFYAGSATPASAPFRVDTSGNLVATNATITGTITSTAGTIGGWTIASNTISNSNITLDAANGRIQAGPDAGNYTRINQDGIFCVNTTLGTVFRVLTDGSPPLISGGIIQSTKFEITSSGILETSATAGDGTANGAGVRVNNTGVKGWQANNSTPNFLLDATDGSIDAKKGLIGGWTIDATELKAGSGSNTVGLAVVSSGSVSIYAGSATAGTAPFRVTNTGALTATNATITGNVTANSGAIGGFTLTSASLKAGSGATTVGIQTSSIAFFAGNATDSAAPFRVTNGGALTATNATITGNVTANSGAIGGWSITGTEIKSGSGANTVALDSGGTNPVFYAGSATPGSAPYRVYKDGTWFFGSGENSLQFDGSEVIPGKNISFYSIESYFSRSLYRSLQAAFLQTYFQTSGNWEVVDSSPNEYISLRNLSTDTGSKYWHIRGHDVDLDSFDWDFQRSFKSRVTLGTSTNLSAADYYVTTGIVSTGGYIGFRFDTDGDLYAVWKKSSSSEVSLLTYSASTSYKLEVFLNPGSYVDFYVNDVLEHHETDLTNIPTGLGFLANYYYCVGIDKKTTSSALITVNAVKFFQHKT